jgi:hypothetical protein
MKFLTKNILDFYKPTDRNNQYLTKYFTNTNNLGLYLPNAADPVDKYPIPNQANHATIDEHNTYEINRFGFRGEIDENSDVLASGCSITFGLGVPESGRWTNILGNRINKSVTNLGNPGGSAESISTNIIQYCLNNKMPKEIFCLFPDFFRSMVVVDKEFYRPKVVRGLTGNDSILSLTFCNPNVILHKDSLLMDVEDQEYIEDATSPHQLILDAVNFIYILESFCSSNNIKLYWTTWDLNTNILMEQLSTIKDFKLKNFTSFFPPGSRMSCSSVVRQNCKSDHGSEFINSMWWDQGSDYSIVNNEKTSNYSHPGIHFQHHVADLFYDLYKRDAELTTDQEDNREAGKF